MELGLPHLPHAQRPRKRGRHIDVIAEQLERFLTTDEIMTLLLNLPPGHTKSALLILAQAWAWTIDPGQQFMAYSYSDSLITTLSKELTDFLDDAWMLDRFGRILIPNAGVKQIHTLAGGFRKSATVGGGSLVGHHGSVAFVDDPMDPKASTSARGKVIENLEAWLHGKVISRAAVGKRLKLCMAMQRLHLQDPSGLLLRARSGDPDFVHLNFPHEFEPDRACAHDWRTKAGEMLWPEDPTRDYNAQQQAKRSGGKMGEEYRAQQQQDPSSGSDRIFDPATFQDFADAPAAEEAYTVISVDPTFTAKQTSDDCAIEVWGYYGGHFYCYHSDSRKRGFHDTVKAIVETQRLWKVSAILIEAAAAGLPICEHLTNVLRIPGVVPVPATKEKAVRARGAAIHFNAGAVHFDKSAQWYEQKARLLAQFTGVAGGHDDSVDTTTQAINWLAAQCGSMAGFDDAMTEMGPELRAAGFGLDLGLS